MKYNMDIVMQKSLIWFALIQVDINCVVYADEHEDRCENSAIIHTLFVQDLVCGDFKLAFLHKWVFYFISTSQYHQRYVDASRFKF